MPRATRPLTPTHELSIIPTAPSDHSAAILQAKGQGRKQSHDLELTPVRLLIIGSEFSWMLRAQADMLTGPRLLP